MDDGMCTTNVVLVTNRRWIPTRISCLFRYRTMPLTLQDRIDLILMAGNRSSREVAEAFNQVHPGRQPVSARTVRKLIQKFRDTGSVHDKPRTGRPSCVADPQVATAVLAAVAKSPQKSTRRLSLEYGVSQPTVVRILRNHKWHPYKLQLHHKLCEDDPDRRLEFCQWALQRFDEDAQFASSVLFSDEANFYVNGEVNKQNHRYWSDENPHWMDPSKTQNNAKVMVWCGIWGHRIIGPFFIYGNLTAASYLHLLKEEVFPSLLTEDGRFPRFFQQDGAPPHYGAAVRTWLDNQFPQHWIGRRGSTEWPPRSPDLTPLDFYLWGHLKAMVYQCKINDTYHLQLRILDACSKITPDILQRVQTDWKRRLGRCVAHNGGHFEHIL